VRDREKDGRRQRWIRAQTTPDTSFGPYVSLFFFFLFSVSSLLINVYCLYRFVNYEVRDRERDRRRQQRIVRAQTTPDASFGP